VKLNIRKLTVGRFFIIFAVLCTSVVGGVVYYQKVQEQKSEELRLKKKMKLLNLSNKVRDKYVANLSGGKLSELLNLQLQFEHVITSLSSLGKSVKLVKCKYNLSSSGFLCKVEVDDSSDGYYSIPEIPFAGKDYKPLVKGNSLFYSDILFPIKESENLKHYKKNIQFFPIECNDTLVQFGFVDNMIESVNASISIMTPMAVNEERGLLTKNVNNSYYFSNWEFNGGFDALPMLFFSENNSVIKEFELDIASKLIQLKGVFTCSI